MFTDFDRARKELLGIVGSVTEGLTEIRISGDASPERIEQLVGASLTQHLSLSVHPAELLSAAVIELTTLLPAPGTISPCPYQRPHTRRWCDNRTCPEPADA